MDIVVDCGNPLIVGVTVIHVPSPRVENLTGVNDTIVLENLLVLSLLVELDPQVHERAKTYKSEDKIGQNKRVSQFVSKPRSKKVAREAVTTKPLFD